MHWSTSNPRRADSMRDERDDARDLSDHAQAILDALHHKPDLIDAALNDEEVQALDELLSKLRVGAGRIEERCSDELGEAA